MHMNIVTFLAANPGLNLQNADLFIAEKLAQYHWPANADQKALLQSLRTRQRLLKVYPDENVAAALEGLGLHSAHHIASPGETAFTQKAAPELAALSGVPDPGALCAQIFANAERIRRSSFELALAQRPTTELTVTTSRPGGNNPDFQEGIPDYQRLFGPMLTCDCDDCQSIFGPAAYLTDLMRVVTNYITQPSQHKFTLKFRRPDLWTLPLDCNTAETEVSYLDIVNSILKQNLKTNFTGGADPMYTIASAVYPFTAPYNEPLETIRIGLHEMGTGLPQIYHLMETPAPAAASAALHLSPEQLILINGTSTTALWQLYGFYSEPEDIYQTLSQQKEFLQKTGLKPAQLKELVYQNLKQGDGGGGYAMYNNGSRDIFTDAFLNNSLGNSITAECWILPGRFFGTTSIFGKNNSEFNIFLDSAGLVQCTYITSAGNVQFKSAQAVVLNAWTHIAWSRDITTGENMLYINGTLSTTYAAAANQPATVSSSPLGIGYVGGTSFLGALSEIRIWSTVRTEAHIRSFMRARLKDYTASGLLAYWPLNETSGDVANDLGPNHYNATRANSIYFTFYEALPFGNTNEMNPVLLSSLYLNSCIGNSQYVMLSGNSFDAATDTITPASLLLTTGATGSDPFPPNAVLNSSALDQLAVYIRLHAQTGWPFGELDWILKSVSGTQTTVTNTIIESLGQVMELKSRYNIHLDELSVLWYDMKTYGRGNGANPHDLWDRVYNTPPLMAGADESAFYRPQYEYNPLFSSPVLTWTFKNSDNTQDQRLSNQLAAALDITGADLAAIVNSVAEGASSMLLTVQALSQLYRVARFAQMLGIKVPDFISLLTVADLQLSTSTLAWNLAEVVKICNYAEWLKKTKISIDQLNYLTTPGAPTDKLRFPDQATVEKGLNSMVDASAQLRVSPDGFTSPGIDDATAQQIFSQLVQDNIIDKNGLVLNAEELTLINVYKALAADNTLAQQIIHAGPATSVIDFSSANADTVCFSFDPFADATIQGTNSFTINLWMKPASTYTGGWPHIAGNTQEGGGKSPGIVMVQFVDEALQIESTCSNGQFYGRQAADFLQWADQWVFVSFVNSGGTWSMYRNGELVPFISGSNGPFPTVYTQTGATPQYFMASAFTGSVSNLAIWNTPRSPEQLQQDMFACYSGDEAGLLAYWPADEGEGTVIYNQTATGGAAYNGAFTNNKSNTPTWVPNSGLADVQRIWQVLVDARDAQTALVIKTVAGLSSITQQQMSGVCALTSDEVNNAAALGVSAGPLPYAPNLLLNPDMETNPNRTAYLKQLQRNGALTRWFKLTGEEAGNIGAYSQQLGNKSITFGSTVFTLSQLIMLSEYKSLQQLCNATNGLIEYFKTAPPIATPPATPTPSQVALLAQLTGWNEDELNKIFDEPYFSEVNFSTVPGLRKLANVMAMEEKLNMGIASLNMLRNISGYSAASNTDWQAYKDTAAAVTGALTAKKGRQTTPALQGEISKHERGVLCDWIIWELTQTIKGASNRDELYEYLLIDVNMSPDVKVSWTVAAMNSLQLYVNRCISNMEPGVENNIPEAWWKWMSTYRLWQANREVYLYPENYVDPGLRKMQSPEFKQFISDISKGQITDDNVKQALAAYLESVNEVSNLELIDGFVDPVYNMAAGTSQDNRKNIIFLVARSRTNPADFYTRATVLVTSNTAVADGVLPDDASNVHFGPWQKINLKINSDYVSTAIAFGRQFIFWLEQTEVINTSDNGKKYTTVYGSIYYSYRDFEESWVAPIVLKKDIVLSVFGKSMPAVNYYEGYLNGSRIGNTTSQKQYPFYKELAWEKVSLQYIPATRGVDESILVILGDLVTCNASVSVPPAEPTETDMTDEQAAFQNQLYAAAKHTYHHMSDTTTIIPGILLFSSLLQKQIKPQISSANALFVEGMLEQTVDQTQLFFAATNNLISPLPARVSWWPLVQNFGLTTTTTAKDIVSKKNGTNSNVNTWTKGAFPNLPNAMIPVFNTNNYFYFNWSANLNNTASTFAFWIKSTSAAEGYILRAPLSSNTSIVRLYECAISNNVLVICYYNKSTSPTNASIALTASTWYFVTLTTSSSGLNIYLNGLLQTQSSLVNTTIRAVSSLYFGGFNGNGFGFQYWDCALTGEQVTFLYHENEVPPYLTGLHRDTSSLYRLSNSAGAFAFNSGNQSYLVFPDLLTEIKPISQCLHVTYHESNNVLQITFKYSPLESVTTNPLMQFVRINTETIPLLIAGLARGGMRALYQPEMQYLPEQSLGAYSPSSLAKLPQNDAMNFNGACSVYFWEIFFYAPFLIAEKLQSSQRFEEAEKWYQYIFDPTALSAMPSEKWYDFLFNSESPTAPVAFWPLNKNSSTNTNEEFDPLKGSETLTGTGLTSASAQRLPFAFLDRTIWTFSTTNNSKVTTPYSAALNPDEFTITAWVKLTSAPTSSQNTTVINSQSGSNGYHLFFKYISEGVWVLNMVVQASLDGAATGFVAVNSPNLNTLNEWQFVAGKYDGKSLKVYINGRNVSQTGGSVTGYVKNPSGVFRVGCGNSSTTNAWYFNGAIADVAVYNYAMRGSAINRLYQNYTSLGPNAAFWKFRPFQRINAESLYHILRGDAWNDQFLQPAEYYSASLQMAVFEYDPFDPDTLARLRINSWQKATFMRYIDNLINWGDSLFTQDTWETLSTATMRYVLANTLLGQIPLKTVVEEPQPTVNYNSIELEYGAANVPQFLIQMENQLSQLGPDATLPQQVQSILDAYFCIPANKKMLNYWGLVADRLYKLRHGLTITGAPNVIPLYSSRIDPSQLVAAAASGTLNNVTSASIPAVPWFRFTYIIAQAKAVTAEAGRLGGELLAALEKKDAEQLAQLQAGYQLVFSNLNVQIKANQVNQLQYVGQGLQASYTNAEYMHNTYRDWMLVPVGPLEALSLLLAADSAIGQQIATDIRALAVPSYLLPNIFGLADGGMGFGDSINAASSIIEGDAHLIGAISQMTAQMGQFLRRELEWNLQKNIAANQMKEIEAQIQANNFALKAAETDARLNQAQLQESQDVYNFLKSKFTNEELYDWMSGQLSTLYFQMFQLAWSLGQGAQTALQYEINLNQSYLNAAAWNASYQGLLAGDSLSLALQQMENAYITGNNRKLEIRKTWSMRQNNPQALLTLVATGDCRFDLSELSYDLDFPGHYNRKIKSLSVTIPAVVGPYQNIHAALLQMGNTVCTTPSLAAVQYLLGLSNTPPSDGSLRTNWNPNQEIIISTGINDAGVFQINFNDEQYLPFEGTGAVSSWSLSVPQAANAFPLRSISDVIITVDYTAEDGGNTFVSQITALEPLINYKGWQYLSMRQLYSAAWFNFCDNPDGDIYSLAFELVTQMYPANLVSGSITLGNSDGEIALAPVLKQGYSGDLPSFSMNGAGEWSVETGLLPVSEDAAPQPVPGKGNPWTLTATFSSGSGLLTNGKINQTILLDIILVVPFNGTLNW